MPCRYDNAEDDHRQFAEARKADREKLDNLTRMLCALCQMTLDNRMPLTDELIEWYSQHKEWDKKRLADAKKSALAKLSDDEKEALGL